MSPIARRFFSWAVPSNNLADQRVVFGISLADVDAGEKKRRNNDKQADRDADPHHTCAHWHAEALGCIGDKEDEAEIDDQHDQRQRPAERRASANQLLIIWVLLDLLVAAQHPRSLRSSRKEFRTRASKLPHGVHFSRIPSRAHVSVNQDCSRQTAVKAKLRMYGQAASALIQINLADGARSHPPIISISPKRPCAEVLRRRESWRSRDRCM